VAVIRTERFLWYGCMTTSVCRETKRGKYADCFGGIAEKRFGLVVDELIGNQEVVVTNLGSYIGKVEGISGATILGDRSVACILDVVGVANIVTIDRHLNKRRVLTNK